jgi:hypothetical protein
VWIFLSLQRPQLASQLMQAKDGVLLSNRTGSYGSPKASPANTTDWQDSPCEAPGRSLCNARWLGWELIKAAWEAAGCETVLTLQHSHPFVIPAKRLACGK